MKNSSLKEVYSGVYKISFPNGKIYIGISNNMYRRMLEHNTDFRNNLPIEKAIKKYGPITEFEIIEIISPLDRNKMREREQYWIKYFNSNNKNVGYNISSGGDGADYGSNNHEARFTEEEILNIYDELKNNLSISLQSLANKYGVGISTISAINNGKTYYHSSIEYPIRNSKDCKKIISGIKNHNSSITKEKLQQIYTSLINEQDISMKELAQNFNISSTIIQNINSGKTYHNNNYVYPLRKSKTGVRKISEEKINEIIETIKKDTSKSLTQIAKDFEISPRTISGINCGNIYKRKQENYPIRKKH